MTLRTQEPVLLRAARIIVAERLDENDPEASGLACRINGAEFRRTQGLAQAYVHACEESDRLREERDKLIESCLFSVTECDGRPIAFTWRIAHESFSPTHAKFVQAVRAALGLRHEREPE